MVKVNTPLSEMLRRISDASLKHTGSPKGRLANEVIMMTDAMVNYVDGGVDEDFKVIPIDEQWIVDNEVEDFIVVMALKGEYDWGYGNPISLGQMANAKNGRLIVNSSDGQTYSNKDWRGERWDEIPSMENIMYRHGSKDPTNRDYWLIIGMMERAFVLNFTHNQLQQIITEVI